MAREGKGPGTGKARRAPKPLTPERLEKAALAYLERYASSAENLRRVLMRRLQRSARLHGPDGTVGAEQVAALVDRYVRAGLVDDRLYARSRATSLWRAGNGQRAIALKLRAKGVSGADVSHALAALGDEAGEADADLIAAIRHARRRRLGPFGNGGPERRQRDIAALARRGFPPDLASLIVGAENEAALADRLTDRGIDLYAL